MLGLLALEGFLLLSERFEWFAFNRHKGWTVLIAVASVVVAMLLMFLWFLAALVFRWRYQFSIRSLLVLTVVVAVGVQLAGGQEAAGEAATGGGGGDCEGRRNRIVRLSSRSVRHCDTRCDSAGAGLAARNVWGTACSRM